MEAHRLKITGDLNLIKKINTSIVLDVIVRQYPISRARISEVTGLTKATVSSLVNDLIASHMVTESGMGESSGGRKPVMLLFNKCAGYAIGIDLDIHCIIGVLTDLEGNIVDEIRIDLKALSVDAVVVDLKTCIRQLIEHSPKSPYGIIGIGIGVPGMVNEAGTIVFAPNLAWENVSIQALIAEEFNIPVIIDNEANAGAVGEKQFGAGKSTSNMIYVSLGVGIGTGIIIKNELYRGFSGISGEMGHVTIEAHGRKCSCGNIGCWELYASENALLEKAKALSFASANPPPSIQELIHLAETGNQEVIELLVQTGQYLGMGIINIMNTFNPELIIIGSRLTAAEPWLLKPIQQLIAERSFPYSRREMRIEFSSLGAKSTVLGAAFFAIAHFFATTKISVE
ncbi:ROK family transcriptional regulator [Paenibacillus psychroresistens]|uniref:ROK family transcriptional regulator n=1 Tax=Paenibacillus psychroresistens TaxID=1778678 RepID=A0A6B8RG00_9BACL|nr:ROK family transcriptional regulator [Paenibacillus psychroresistens]